MPDFPAITQTRDGRSSDTLLTDVCGICYFVALNDMILFQIPTKILKLYFLKKIFLLSLISVFKRAITHKEAIEKKILRL